MQNLRAGYFKLRSICLGWWRFLFNKRTKMSQDRIDICMDCELRKGRFCGVCYCELDALATLDQSEGGICKHPDGSRWDAIDRHNQKGRP
jgi:hypothetical protein